MEPFSKADLDAFTGSEHQYRHWARRLLFTDGIKYLADRAGAYWLIDEIALAQTFDEVVSATEFQVWDLKVSDSRGRLSCTDGNENEVFAKDIPWTDFPLDAVRMFFANRTLYLPSEH